MILTCSTSFILQAILFDYNVQHDCYAARCSSNPQELIQQNHAQAGTTQAVIVHAAPEQYVINTHSLHNPHLIRQTVSRQLIAPVLKHIDRDSLHNEQARSLQTARGQTGINNQNEVDTQEAAANQSSSADATAADSYGRQPSKRRRFEAGLS